jgi:hypothetical protein
MSSPLAANLRAGLVTRQRQGRLRFLVSRGRHTKGVRPRLMASSALRDCTAAAGTRHVGSPLVSAGRRGSRSIRPARLHRRGCPGAVRSIWRGSCGCRWRRLEETMFMAPAGKRSTQPICEACLSPAEREFASGQCGVGCQGCYRTPDDVPVRRAPCASSVGGLPKPPSPPTQTWQRCGCRFVPKYQDRVIYCGTKCRIRARDDRRLALARAKRNQRRSSATVTVNSAM